MRSRVAVALTLSSAAWMPLPALADAQLQTFLQQTLTAAREKHQLPAVAALVQIDGRIEAEAAVGMRATGSPQRVTIRDKWHLGSDTKAFTATLIGRLVEQGVMRFDDTLEAALPALTRDMHPAHRAVTVAQLLSHTAGLAPLTDDAELPPVLQAVRSATGLPAQRMAVTRSYLAQPPASPAGQFAYSNPGYIVAGAIAEARTGQSWEQLVRTQVLAPLGITGAGFGAPGISRRVDQPRGHAASAGAPSAIDPADAAQGEPPVIGPAGTLHMPLRDWMRFAQDQLDGVHGRGRLLQAQTYRRLHAPVADNYALGWGVMVGPDGAPLLLTHSGSNGHWLADIRIMPRRNIIVLVVTNAGNEAANQAIVDIGKPLRDRLRPFD